jgi:isoquinoline 1-oxidoreductase beta subunit
MSESNRMRAPHSAARRVFLRSTALAGGGLALGIVFPSVAPGRLGSSAHAANEPLAPSQWIRIHPDNRVVIIVDKSEMGQGVATSMPMLIAEELSPDWSRVSYEFAPAAPQYANPLFGTQGTGGSTSVRAMYEPLRRAGAAARELLRQAAAKHWQVELSAVDAADGWLTGPDARRASYGEISTLAAGMVPPDPATVAVRESGFRLLGKPVRRLDSPEKVDGSAVYGMDVRLPGQLTALVARSPTVGAKVESYDAQASLAVRGVRAVVPVTGAVSDGVAVLADSYWAAKLGRDALKVNWREDGALTLSDEEMRAEMRRLALTTTDPVSARDVGDVEAARAVMTVTAEYDLPYLAHAPMEPMNITAWVREGHVEIHGGTQGQGPNQATVGQILGIDPALVQITTTHLGGGFGRRFAPDALIEAVQLSKAVEAPVRLVYSREDDMRGQYYRPAVHARVRGGLDAEGRPLFMSARTVCSSVAKGSGFEGALVQDRLDVMSTEGLDNWPYDCPNQRVEWIPYEPGIRTWFWRSVGNSQNAFIAETFIDELAYVAGRDPYEFRRDLLSGHPRHRAALDLAAERAGWGSPLPAGRARGIAVAESFGSYVAQVVEVSVSEGRPRVHRVVIGADVGTVVNPDTTAAQLEGAMVYGLSAALYGRITLESGRIVQSNFHDYPVLRMSEMPAVEVHLVQSAEPPGGVGEPGTPPLAPALANALYALTGRRIRRLPLDLSV